MSQTEELNQDQGSEDRNFITDLVTEKAQLNRRAFVKTSALLFGGAVGSATAITIAGQPVRAQVTPSSGDTDAIANTEGNVVEDVRLAGDTEFGIQWSDLIRGDIIELDLSVAPTHVSTPPSNRDPNQFTSILGQREVLGRMGFQVPQSSGSATVTGSEFFVNRSDPKLSLTKHNHIDSEFFNVDFAKDLEIVDGNLAMDGGIHGKKGIRDLDAWKKLQEKTGSTGVRDKLIDGSKDSYVRSTVYNTKIHARLPGDSSSQVVGNWDLVVIVNVNAGWGLVFGETFGVKSEEIG